MMEEDFAEVQGAEADAGGDSLLPLGERRRSEEATVVWILDENALDKRRSKRRADEIHPDWMMFETWMMYTMDDVGRRMFVFAQKGKLTDMEFVLDNGTRFRAHRAWMIARSAYLRAMLSDRAWEEGRTGVVRVRECEESTFSELLEFLYTAKWQPDRKKEVLDLADFFRVKDEMMHGGDGPHGVRWSRFLRDRLLHKVMEEAGRMMFDVARAGGELTDMEFLLDSGKTFRAHKFWVMASCENVEGMMSSGVREGSHGTDRVQVTECSDGAFIAFLEFLYLGRLGTTCLGQDWVKLWELAEKFGVVGMQDRLLDAVHFRSASTSFPPRNGHGGNVEQAARVAVALVAEGRIFPLIDRCTEELELPWDGMYSLEEANIVLRVANVLRDRAAGADWILDIIGTAVDKALREFEDCWDVEGIVELLKVDWNNSADIPKRCCSALIDFDDDDEESRSLVVAAGGVEAVVELLKAGWASAKVLQKCCRALRCLCANDEKAERLAGAAGGVEAVVEALIARPENAKVQGHGCAALGSLCCDDEENAIRVGEVGGVEAVVEALKAHRSSAEVKEQACAALGKLILDCPWNRRLAVAAGGLEAIVEALKDNKTAVVQSNACSALATMCEIREEYHDEHGPEIWRRAGEAGGVEAVVEALKAHPDDWGVQTSGCRALYQLCGGERFDEEYDPDSCRRSVEVGGVEAVVQALNLHEADARVQKYGCAVLWALSEHGCKDFSRAGHAGAVKAVMRARNAHKTDDFVQEHAFRALCDLCPQDDYEKCLCAVEAGVLQAVVEEILIAVREIERRRYWRYEVVSYGIQALECLSYHRDEQGRCIAHPGGAEALMRVLIEMDIDLTEIFPDGEEADLQDCFARLDRIGDW